MSVLFSQLRTVGCGGAAISAREGGGERRFDSGFVLFFKKKHQNIADRRPTAFEKVVE